MFDRAVFSARIHTLQHDQQRPAAIRIQPFLQLAKSGGPPVNLFFCSRFPIIVLLVVARIIGIIIFQSHPAARFHPIAVHRTQSFTGVGSVPDLQCAPLYFRGAAASTTFRRRPSDATLPQAVAYDLSGDRDGVTAVWGRLARSGNLRLDRVRWGRP